MKLWLLVLGKVYESVYIYIWVFPKIGGKPPKWMVYNEKTLKNKWMIWWFPIFLEGHPYISLSPNASILSVTPSPDSDDSSENALPGRQVGC